VLKILDNVVKKMGIIMTWVKIKKFLVCIFMITFFVAVCNSAFAITEVNSKLPKVVVISDSAHRNGTTYLVCGAASDIFASDIINQLNKTGRIKAPLLGENMSQIAKHIPLYTHTFYNEYKYNYNVDYVNLKRITRNIDSDYILMITSGLDIQSQFFKENWWNSWGLSSSLPITPTYKLVTMMTLIDSKSYQIVWQNIFQRDIKAENMDLGITQFSPNYSQLAKIKKYSLTMSEYVASNVEKIVAPTRKINTEPKALELKSRFLNEGTKIYYPTVNGEVVKQNFDETKQNISNFTSKQQSRWKQFREKRQQNKNIKNINRVQEKKQQEVLPVNDATENLFDSIRNNVDDVTNTLPDEKKESTMVPVKQEKTQVLNDNKKNKSENNESKFVKPIVKENLPAQTQTDVLKNGKPQNYVTPIEYVEPRTPVDTSTPKNHVPRYDWNLKNIYLQKIGLSNLY